MRLQCRVGQLLDQSSRQEWGRIHLREDAFPKGLRPALGTRGEHVRSHDPSNSIEALVCSLNCGLERLRHDSRVSRKGRQHNAACAGCWCGTLCPPFLCRTALALVATGDQGGGAPEKEGRMVACRKAPAAATSSRQTTWGDGGGKPGGGWLKRHVN